MREMEYKRKVDKKRIPTCNIMGVNIAAINMEWLLDYIEKNAVQYREIGVTAADSVMGFSTCAEAETNGRVVVFGRLTKRS